MGKNKDSYSYIRYYCPCGETILISANAYYRMSDEELLKYLDDHCPKHIISSFNIPSFSKNITTDISKLDEQISLGWDDFLSDDDFNYD